MLAGSPFRLSEIEAEFQITMGLTEAEKPGAFIPPLNEEVERKSREARKIIGLEISEVRAIKNRLLCSTMREVIELYLSFSETDQGDRFEMALKSCLIHELRTKKMIQTILNIISVEQPKTMPASEREKADKLLVNVDLLNQVGGKDCLLQVFPLWHHDLRDMTLNWPALPVFLRLRLNSDQILEVCDYV